VNTSKFELLSAIFEKEAVWLSKIIRQRMNLFTKNKNDATSLEGIPECIVPEHKDSNLAYTNFINENKLSFEERILLALITIPHIQPHFLFDQFTYRNSMNQIITKDYTVEFPEIGLVKSKNIELILPTQLTFLFLLGGRNIKKRLTTAALFNSQSVLIEKKIIHIERPASGELMYSGKLILSQVYFELFTSSMVESKINSHAN
jgi:hypothetical protein